ECAPGDDRADIAAANDTERLPEQLDPEKTRFLPFAGLGRPICHRDLAGQRKHHCDRVFGCSDRIAVGRIHDNDAALGCRRDIDIVDPDAGAADDLEIARRVEALLYQAALAASRCCSQAQSSQGRSASTSLRSTVAPVQMRMPGGEARWLARS